MKKVLEIKGLNKSYGNHKVLKSLNLNLYQGDIYGLIGPNGAGKSTLIKVILQLIKKDGGSINFKNQTLKQEDIQTSFGATIEEPNFYEYLTGRENLNIHKRLLKLSDEDVDQVLEFVSMQDVADKKVSDYSLGMKQRLAIARAFLNKPEVLVLDEPTNGLDPKGVIELRQLIAEMQKQGTSIIFCSHQLSEVQTICNRFGFLKEGHIVEENIKTKDNQIKNLEGYF